MWTTTTVGEEPERRYRLGEKPKRRTTTAAVGADRFS
jgi:hypothetical protein